MVSSDFDLSLLSKYRTQLMGLAAIMIVLCHIASYVDTMPNLCMRIISYGGMGVDIFLFLSGLGCYYSLSQGVRLKSWYKKRFVKIFVPYFFMQIPFWLYRLFIGKFNLFHELSVFSTIGFWTQHKGAWYVALLLPLYLLAPALYSLLKEKERRLVSAILLILFLLIICHLKISYGSGAFYTILNNMQWAFIRIISFIVGMSIAPYVKDNVKINVFVVFAISVCLYVAIHVLIDKNIFIWWCMIWPLMIIFILFLQRFSIENNIFRFVSWMGAVSLESYLANIYLCEVFKKTSIYFYTTSILINHQYIEYFLIIVLGLLLSFIVHGFSIKIIRRI